MIAVAAVLWLTALPAANLPPGAERIAELIGVMPTIEELRGIEDRRSLKALSLRQDILEDVTRASLEGDAAIAEIQDEQAQLQAVRNILEKRRDRRVAVTNIAGMILSTGMGVVATSLQFGPSNAGNAIGAGSGAAATVLSVVGLRQQQGGMHKLPVTPNMLARFFDRPGTAYPDIVWSYLTYWRAELFREWQNRGLIDLGGSPQGRSAIDFLTAGMAERRKFSIDQLETRATMLGDVRARVSLMKRDLSELLDALRKER